MKRSIFDSIFEITDELSVVTVVIQDKRYGLIHEYLHDGVLHITQVNKNPHLHFAETHQNNHISGKKLCRKDILESMNFIADQCISSSYNVTFQQINHNIVSSGKELVYSSKLTVVSGQDKNPIQVVPIDSEKWVKDQMKRLGIKFISPVIDPAFSTSGLFCIII